MADEDIVFFMHNGEKVSNDPRWLMEREAEKAQKRAERAKELEMGDPLDTSTVPPATLQAAADSTPDDSESDDDDDTSNGVGSDPDSDDDSGDDEDDSDEDDDEDNEDDTSKYSEMSSKDLKAEVKTRRDAGRELDTKGITKKSELIELLVADDAAQASAE